MATLWWSEQFSSSQTNGESSPEMLSIQFQGAMRTRDDGQNSVRSSISSPASISPRPSSPYSPPSPGYRSGSPYSPQRPRLPSEGRGESMVNSRRLLPVGFPPVLQPNVFLHVSLQEQRSFTHSSVSPVPVLPPLNGSPSSGSYSLYNPWEIRRDQDRSSSSSFNRSCSLDSEPAMHRLEGDSEVYKMMQENRETRAPPRQSSTFRLLQVALELDEKGAGTQAVRIQENRYRHPSCYICTDCGLNLKMRGHFWVGEEMYCEKHARQRYQGPAGGSTVTAVYSQS
ncbi:hypothetical protein JD844_031125 [Phrynosoma platyrhinos]|uniref:PDZ and LIM domain protein 2 n=1 Tax=Phrynosoma platyrhinos TaxID=52577 RepID=A0ABQ7T0U1_PHRPL|nr:hypothetical protein JD844_031125 [Phrynosoma platyrhinos]